MRVIRAIVAAAALAGSVGAAPASAIVLTFVYNGVQTGDTPASTPPWLTATFADSPAGVVLTLTASLEAPTEFITTVKFNLDPSLNAALLNYTGASSPNSAFPSISGSNNGIPGQGLTFDWELGFQTSAGAGRFAGTDVFQALLLYNTSPSVLSASDFDFLSGAQGENTPRYSLAHVQGIAPNGSGWVFGDPGGGPPAGVPEPGTLALLGMALIGFVAASRRRIRG